MSFDFTYLCDGGPRVSHSSVVSAECVYFLFGEDGKNVQRQYLSSALRYDVTEQSADSVSLKYGQEIVPPRSSCSCTMVTSNKFLAFGGNRGLELLNESIIGTLNNSSDVIPMKKLTSYSSSNYPCHRRGHQVVSIGGGKLLLFGGIGMSSSKNDTYFFDSKNEQWRCAIPHDPQNPRIPSPRTNHAMCSFYASSTQSLTAHSTPPQCVMLYGGHTLHLGKQSRVPSGVCDDCWLFDVQAEKWHSTRLRVYGNTAGMGRRVGHTLSPMVDQPYSCLLFGGGPDVETMLMCNDAFVIDLRMNGAYSTGSSSSFLQTTRSFSLTSRSSRTSRSCSTSRSSSTSRTSRSGNRSGGGGSGDDTDRSGRGGDGDGFGEGWEVCEPQYSPFVLQPSVIQKKSIAPRMYHTADCVGESYYIIYGGYAGHRTCGGVWGMNLANSSADTREKQRRREVRNKEKERDRDSDGRGRDTNRETSRSPQRRQPANEQADPGQNYHHIPFAPSPFEPVDPHTIRIREVQMVGSDGQREMVSTTRRVFPNAYKRVDDGGSAADGKGGSSTTRTRSGASRTQSSSSFDMPSDDITRVIPNFDIYSVKSFGTPDHLALDVLDRFITYMTINSFYRAHSDDDGDDDDDDDDDDNDNKTHAPCMPPPPRVPLARGQIPYASQPLYIPIPEQIISLCQLVTVVLKEEPSLLSLPLPCKVFGDLHGDYLSLIKFFQQFGDVRQLPKFTFLFLGDYVDRGPHSVNILCLLFALKIRYPTRIYLLRGNHESRSMCGDNHKYTSLFNEMGKKYSSTRLFLDKRYKSGFKMGPEIASSLWNLFIDTFEFLPFAAVIGRCIFAVHGGLSHGLPTLNQIFLIPRGKTKDAILERHSSRSSDSSEIEVPRGRGADSLRMVVKDPRPYQTGVILTPAQELIWNDAARTESQEQPWVLNDLRKCGYYFNTTVVDNFLKQNGLKLILRGHEVCLDGFDYFAKRKLITVFSCPRYCGMDNHGVIVDVFSETNVQLKVLDGRNSVSVPPTREQERHLIREYNSNERAPTPPRPLSAPP